MKYLAKTTISISGMLVEVDIYRNSVGNLEVHGIYDPECFPEGVSVEGLNEEIIFSKFVS